MEYLGVCRGEGVIKQYMRLKYNIKKFYYILELYTKCQSLTVVVWPVLHLTRPYYIILLCMSYVTT